MKLKDWWSVILSTLAFLISATGFYLNSLEQSEAVSAALYSLPEVRVQDNKFVLEGSMRVAFINSGNQHAAIMGMYVSPKQLCVTEFFWDFDFTKAPPAEDPCYDPAGDGIYALLKQGFVIKPGEIVVKEIEITPPEVRPGPLNLIKNLELEFEFSFITPSTSNAYTRANVVVSGFTDMPTGIKNEKSAELRPIVIRSQTNNFLKAWWNDRFASTNQK
jgi:hypothetical protein